VAHVPSHGNQNSWTHRGSRQKETALTTLRNSRYLDYRTANNVKNMSRELSEIVERLKLFGLDADAERGEHLVAQLHCLGQSLADKLGKKRIRKRESLA